MRTGLNPGNYVRVCDIFRRRSKIEPEYLTRFRSETAERPAAERRATEARAGVLEQYVEQAEKSATKQTRGYRPLQPTAGELFGLAARERQTVRSVPPPGQRGLPGFDPATVVFVAAPLCDTANGRKRRLGVLYR